MEYKLTDELGRTVATGEITEGEIENSENSRPPFERMCEVIAEFLEEAKGIKYTPEQIFKSAPNGELTVIGMWYEKAKSYFDNKDKYKIVVE